MTTPDPIRVPIELDFDVRPTGVLLAGDKLIIGLSHTVTSDQAHELMAKLKEFTDRETIIIANVTSFVIDSATPPVNLAPLVRGGPISGGDVVLP